MESKERSFIVVVLVVIVVMVTMDIVGDAQEGVGWWHLLVEAAIACAALVGIFLLLRGSFSLKRSLAEERKLSLRFQTEAENWRSQSKKYLDGLSQTIDSQLTNWKLTQSEKEVAFLLLKGLSLKEIAEIRKTAEKTARTQSISIYSKAGLAGRSELAAFFLEDLFPPSQEPPAVQP
ncbi:MAG: hypothetical protein JST80_13390 [Bdellovibrionales bacterium]|nr:hypothetical protein [Bdellovibrionales bacterium]